MWRERREKGRDGEREGERGEMEKDSGRDRDRVKLRERHTERERERESERDRPVAAFRRRERKNNAWRPMQAHPVFLLFLRVYLLSKAATTVGTMPTATVVSSSADI